MCAFYIVHTIDSLLVAISVLTDKDRRRCTAPTFWSNALCCSFSGRAPQWPFSTVAPQWIFFFCCFKHNWSSCTIAHVCCMHHCTLVIHHIMHQQQWKVKRWFAVFTFSRMLPPRCALTGHNIVLNSFGWMHWISSNTHSLMQIPQFCRDISYHHNTTRQSFATLSVNCFDDNEGVEWWRGDYTHRTSGGKETQRREALFWQLRVPRPWSLTAGWFWWAHSPAGQLPGRVSVTPD